LNQTSIQNFVQEARKMTWRDIRVTDRDKLKIALKKKHGSLSKAAESLDIQFIRLSSVVNGRDCTIDKITKIQSDLGLSDEQVLSLWPLLKTWPRKSRVAC